MKKPLVFDHLAVVARTLEEGCSYVKDSLGVDMPKGGKHPAMGTHNHLMALGPESYIEVICVDLDARSPDRPRWFGLDDFDGPPRLMTWVVSTPNIVSSMSDSTLSLGDVLELSRDTLKWEIAVTDSGKLPLDGAFPTLIEWPDQPSHVASSMTDLGCRLTKLEITSPDSAIIETFLNGAINDSRIEIQQGRLGLCAWFDTPSGPRQLA